MLKKAMIALTAVPVLGLLGCDGGIWGTLHQASIHLSEVTQWVAALDQISGIVPGGAF